MNEDFQAKVGPLRLQIPWRCTDHVCMGDGWESVAAGGDGCLGSSVSSMSC